VSTDGSFRVSVILPVRNAGVLFPWEAIVIDNGSTDTSARTARECTSRLPEFGLLSEETPGKSRALNLGTAAAAR
jgi:glycosyltransferase involved in cell wall biosynthesis